MLPIEIKTISQHQQRYETIGDYFNRGNKWCFRISRMNFRSEGAVAVHELIEKILCHWQGISNEKIDVFDLEWEKRSRKSPCLYAEPGDDPEAPYHAAHMFAKKVEKMLVEELGLSWKEHNDICNATYDSDPRVKGERHA